MFKAPIRLQVATFSTKQHKNKKKKYNQVGATTSPKLQLTKGML